MRNPNCQGFTVMSSSSAMLDHPRARHRRRSSGSRCMSKATSGEPRQTPAHLRFSPDDLHLFNEGTHYRLYEKLGAHVLPEGGVAFAVWAPNARYVSVVGDFNG